MDFERRESLDDIQKLFMHCLKAFTQQNVDTLIYEPNLFLWDKNSLDEIMVNDSHKVFRKTQLVFMVCIITREFCRLYNSGERQQNSIIEKLVHSVDLHVIKELNTVLVPGITKNSISSVAYESYESEQTNKAAIAFVPENVDINEALRDDFISIKDIDYITICQDNIHGTRKLLNLSENGTIVYQLTSGPSERNSSFMVKGISQSNRAYYYFPCVLFSSKAQWGVSVPGMLRGGKPILITVCVNGHFRLPYVDNSIGEKKIVATKTRSLNSNIRRKAANNIYKILSFAKQQKKGALIIISEPWFSRRISKRLCRLRQAITVGNNNKGVNLIEHPELVSRFSKIDGAIICDYNGICYSIGAILAGINSKGTMERGSRYNGAINFRKLTLSIMRWRRHFFLLALVVSEDGLIDIL